MSEVEKLCDLVRQTAFDLHKYLGSGHLEKVYENGLVHRLRKTGIVVEQQHPITVYDEDGTAIGEYFADLWVNSMVIVELKATRAISNEHIAQLLGYLKACRIEHGLLINFGSFKFQIRKLAFSRSRHGNGSNNPALGGES